MTTLNGKTAVVTGGNSGIGYATAQELKERGATVVITGRDKARVQQAASDLGVKGYVADVNDLAAIDRLASVLKDELGKIDILFVNAGVFAGMPIEQLTEEAFDYLMDINFKGAVFTVQKLLPLIPEGGSIINLSSVNAVSGMGNASIYAASKAALNAFTRNLTVELSPRKIRVNSVNPGPIETPIFGKTGMEQEQMEQFAGAMQQRVPLNRFGQADEVAKVVAFLASDDAAYVTGSEYHVDGGLGVNIILS